LRRLIINADDFGLTSGVNRAIVEASEHGIVTSSTLMANGSAFDEAVALSRTNPRLGIGCHVILAGRHPSPLLSASEISTLVEDPQLEPAQFYGSIVGFARRALTGKLDPHQIEKEATAQIRKLQASGIALTHIDTHKHTHLFPEVLKPLLKAAQWCGVRALRNPFPPARPLPLSLLLSKPSLWKRHFQVRVLNRFSRSFYEAVQQAGMVTTDGTLGVAITGALNAQLFEAVVANLPDGTWEFVTHPGYNDADLQNAGTRLLESRAKELEVFTSPAAREALSLNKVELINFGDL
jgi:chitin disaccharide deacetylase